MHVPDAYLLVAKLIEAPISDTRLMTHEKCAGKRAVRAFETNWAGQRLWLRHQPNDFEMRRGDLYRRKKRCFLAND